MSKYVGERDLMGCGYGAVTEGGVDSSPGSERPVTGVRVPPLPPGDKTEDETRNEKKNVHYDCNTAHTDGGRTLCPRNLHPHRTTRSTDGT